MLRWVSSLRLELGNANGQIFVIGGVSEGATNTVNKYILLRGGAHDENFACSNSETVSSDDVTSWSGDDGDSYCGMEGRRSFPPSEI